MAIYRTSVFWDIIVPLLVGLGLVYVLDAVSGDCFGIFSRYEGSNDRDYMNNDERPWAPIFQGRKGSSSNGPLPDQKLLAAMEKNYKLYEPEKSLLPTWVVTPPDVSTIHRFFDSNPFSPSGRYLGLTRMPNVFEAEKQNKAAGITKDDQLRNMAAEVIVLDLITGEEKMVASTNAWGAQLGAQVQWGGSDEELLFNVASHSLRRASEKHTKHKNKTIKRIGGGDEKTTKFVGSKWKPAQKGIAGMVLNPSTGERKALDCPVYHVSSDGKYTVAPHLMKIKYTQLGYGADYSRVSGETAGYTVAEDANDMSGQGPHRGAPNYDGVFVGSVETGECTLVATLEDLAALANVDTTTTPVYGFHTKWSPDNKYILFVLRSLEKKASTSLSSFFSTVAGSEQKAQEMRNRVKRQHLFVMKSDGSDPLHLLSWSSHPFKPSSETPHAQKGSASPITDQLVATLGVETNEMDTYDANHPSWVAGSHSVSINMKANRGSRKGWDVAKLNVDELYKINAQKINGTIPRSEISAASVTAAAAGVGDADNGNTVYVAPAVKKGRATLADAEKLWEKGIEYHRSSGHPIYHPKDSHRYLLLDAYAKEIPWFRSSSTRSGAKGGPSAPLRIVDTRAEPKGDVWAVEIPLAADPGKGELSGAPTDLSSRHALAWRCDMHPAWNTRNYRWIAFNGRPEGDNRQVMVSYVGEDPGEYFVPSSKEDQSWVKAD